MKRSIIIGLLIMLVALAFADTYVIGTGTSTGSSVPFSGLYDYGWSKTIYSVAELSAAGMPSGQQITGLGFYVGNSPVNFPMIDQRVYVRNTTLSAYGTATDETGTGYPNNAGFTSVFQGTITYNGGGWKYFTFSTPFVWNGTSNLEFLFENWDTDYVTGYPTFRYTSTTPNYVTVYKNTDNSFPAVAGTRTYTRANITIVTPSVTPPNPATLIYPANNGFMFMDGVLSWADGGGMPSSYDLYLGTDNPPTTLVGSALTATTFTPTLTANTTYYWQVVPRNLNGGAEDCPVWNFRTPGDTQLVESFDNTTFPPTGWANPGTWSRSTTTPFYGTGTAYKSAGTTAALLSTPMLSITTGSVLDFYYRTSSTTGYGLMNIKYSSDRVTWNQVGSTISMPTTTEWMHASVALDAIAGSNYYLAFEVQTSTSTSSIYIDHVFGPNIAPVAPGPATPTAPANAATAVSEYPTFTWTAPTTGGVPTGYRVYCDTNANPSTLIGTVTGSATLTYTATSALAYDTLYYWKVVPFNATGTSTGDTVWSFTTRPDPTIYSLPWNEDFGTTGTTFPPTNWGRYSGVIANPSTLVANTSYWIQDNWRNDTTVTPVDFSARMNIYSTARYGWLITPPIHMLGDGYQLEFDLALTDYGTTDPITADPNGPTGTDDKFIVLIGNGSSWTPANIVRQWDNAGSPYVYNDIPNTGLHVTLPLNSYTGNYYVAFYGESTLTNADNDFFVDNIMVRQTPAGLPDHVVLDSPLDGATGLDPDHVVLAWTPALTGGTPDYYEVYVGENPIDPASGYYGEYFYETTATTLNLSIQDDITLNYSSHLYWAVLPQTTGGAPDPEDPAFMVWDFTIAPDPTITALPVMEYFDGVTAPAMPWGWTGYVNSTSTAAYVRTYNSSTYAQSAPNSVYLTNSTDAAADLRLITPPISASIPLNTLKLKFYARSSSAGYPLQVGTVSAPDGTGIFTELQNITLTATQAEYTISLDSYAGTDHYICFKHGLGGTYRSIYIDNVQLLQLMPVDLAATAITGTGLLQGGQPYEFVVTVFNEGTAIQSSYDVKLKKHGDDMLATVHVTDPLAPGAAVQHTLNWTPTSGGTYQIYGEVEVTGDGNLVNNVTSEKDVYVVDPTYTIVSVGDDATTTSGYYVPLYFRDKNSVTEELYFNDEMHLQSGTITAVVYKNTFTTTGVVDKPVKIWMAHTAVTDLTGGWLPIDNYTLVFDGTVDFPEGVNYIVIPLDTPYSFTGGTLATRVNRPIDTVYYATTDKFFYTTTATHTNRSRYLASDTTTYDPLAPSGTGTAVGYVPNTNFIVQNAVMQTGAVLEGYVRDASSSPIADATVSLTERVSTTTDATGFYRFTFWENTNVDATASMTNYYSQSFTNLALTMGNVVTQNFVLTAMPRVTISGTVNANDVPAGLVGATITFNGSENHNTTTLTGGAFSIPNVLGSNAGIAYTLTVAMTGYPSYTAPVTVYESSLNLGTVTLVEHLWTAYNLVASHNAGNADLTWDAAAEPDYLLFDFEADNGGWVPSSNWTNPLGDWEWANTYPTGGTFNWTDSAASCVPPTTAHSGTGLWGTKLYTNYSMSGGWSYLTREVNLAGFVNPQLRFWRWNNLYYTYDYYYVQVSTDGTNWTNVLSETAINNAWAEKVVDLSTYANQTISIRFAMYATTVVSYAGLYIDDIYIGPATTPASLAGTHDGSRSFINYSLYRMLAADEATPANWTLLNNSLTNTTYTDAAFGSIAGGTYKWAVKANYSGSQASNAIFSNTLGKVYQPQDISATTVGSTVQIAWTAQPGAGFYKVYAADDPFGTYSYLGYSQTASYTIASPAAYKFYKVVAVADEALPSSAPAKNLTK